MTAHDFTLDPAYADLVAVAIAEELDGVEPAPFYPSAIAGLAGFLDLPEDEDLVGLLDRQDDLSELGAPAPGAPRTPAEAIAEGRRFVAEAVYVGVGYCLKTIRTLYGVGPVWPDAETAWENATQRHPETDPARIPRGVPVWWTNGRFGHVALSIGGGYCLTTDYRRSGFLGVAPIGPLAAWCGGRLVGYSETINGVDVWDAKPAPTFTLDDRIAVVRQALKAAREAKAPRYRIQGLRKWLTNLENRK